MAGTTQIRGGGRRTNIAKAQPDPEGHTEHGSGRWTASVRAARCQDHAKRDGRFRHATEDIGAAGIQQRQRLAAARVPKQWDTHGGSCGPDIAVFWRSITDRP